MQMPLKILIVEYFLPGSTYTLNLANELSNISELTLICKDNFSLENNYRFVLENVLHSRSKNHVDGFIRYIGDLFKIFFYIKKTKPDVIHFEGIVHHKFEMLLVKASKRFTRATFFTAHNILSHEAIKKEAELLDRWYGLFDGVFVHNNASKLALIENSKYRGPICVMPHGTYSEFEIVPTRIINGKITLLCFGLIREYKGIDILIEALSLLPVEIKNKVHVIIAGKPHAHYNVNLTDLVNKYQVSDFTELILRRIDDNEIGELFSRADACVFPYRNIYGSGALLMAYSFEKPVIASDIPTFVEETDGGKCGILFESENPERLKDAIITFCELTDHDKRIMVQNIANLKKNKYNWKKSAEVSLDFYSSVLSNKKLCK